MSTPKKMIVQAAWSFVRDGSMSVEGETASARQQQHHPGDHDFDPVKDSKPTAPSGSEDQRLRSNDFKLQHSLPNALGCRGEVTRQLQASEPLDPEAFGAFNTACLQPSVLLVRFRHSGFRTASEQLQNSFRTASEQLQNSSTQLVISQASQGQQAYRPDSEDQRLLSKDFNDR